jgi:hypothetical protein
VSRREFDFYPTPAPVADALVELAARFVPGEVARIIEPQAGEGAIVRACRKRWPSADLLAYDVRREVRAACLEAGADEFTARDWREPWPVPHADLIIGNPPFADAEAQVIASLERLPYGSLLLQLLPLGFLGGLERARGVWRRPGFLACCSLAPRPSFDGQGSDRTDSAVYLWRGGHTGPALLLPPVCWRGPADLEVPPEQASLLLAGGVR